MIYNTLNISKTGMKSMQTKMDSTANDLANVNTYGYKRKNIGFQELILNQIDEEEVIKRPGNMAINAGSRSGVGKVDFNQGSLISTGGQFHLAIEGNGFFGVRDENNDLLLTRDGSFHINADDTISNNRNQFLDMDLDIPVDEWDSHEISVSQEGVISKIEDDETVRLGQIVLYAPNEEDALAGLGEISHIPVGNVELYNSINNPDAFGTIIQGMLENSNVDISQSMVDMITTQRSYSANARVLQTTDEIIRLINNIKQ